MAMPEQQSAQVGVPMTGLLLSDHTEPSVVDIGEILLILVRRRWLMLIGLLSVLALGALFTLLQRPMYESTCNLLVATNAAQNPNANLPLVSDLLALTQAQSVDTQVAILSNPDMLEEAFESMPYDARMDGFGTEHYTMGSTNKRVTVTAMKNTDIVSITVRARRPQCAKLYANAIGDIYLRQDIEQNRKATQQARIFVEAQLKQVKQKFETANINLAKFKERTGLVAPDAQITQFASNLAEVKSDIEKTRAQIKAGEQAVATYQHELGQLQATVLADTTVANNPRVSTSLARIDELYSQRATLMQDYQPGSPEIKSLDARIADEKTYLKQLTTTIVTQEVHARHPVRDELLKNYATGLADIAAGKSHLQSLEESYLSHTAELKTMPSNERQLAEMMVEADIQKKMVDLLAQQYLTLLISEQATLSNIRVVTKAREAKFPVSPNKMINAVLFFLVGIIISITLAVIAERLDELIQDQEAAEKLSGLTTMGTILTMPDDEAKIIGVDDQRSLLVDHFRVLRNNISFSSLQHKIRLVAVTSTGPSEGKSTCCTNLGIVMALDGKRVLIVDCDLHRPSIHTLLKAPRGIGLTNVVMNTSTLDEAIVITDYPGLSFLPAGILPPNPSEVLNATPTRELFQQLAEMYDIVILDCPPCLKLSDVQIISTIVDGMLMLVAVKQTFKRGLQHACFALSQVSAPLIGLVVNRLDLRQQRYGYYGYYYYGKYDNYGAGAPTKGKRNQHKDKN